MLYFFYFTKLATVTSMLAIGRSIACVCMQARRSTREALLPTHHIFFPLVFLVMNHSCWEIDQMILLLTDWSGAENDEDASKMIKSVVKRSYGVLGYLNETQRLLKLFFFFEIFIQSLNLCTNIYVVLYDPPGNITIFTMTFLQLVQAFIVCWLGNRVILRLEALTAAIYDFEWYKLGVSNRKSLQILLMMAQNIRGFNGIFHEVDMETFKKVKKFSFSKYF